MSKKNKKTTKARAHEFALKREKEALQKRHKNARKESQDGQGKGIKKKATKRRAIKLKKGIRVRGIKVTDARSKKKIQSLLKAEEALGTMDLVKERRPAKKVKLTEMAPGDGAVPMEQGA